MAAQQSHVIFGQVATNASLAFANDVMIKYPKKIVIFNRTSIYTAVWRSGMTDDYAYVTTNSGTTTLKTSAGITPSETGFTLGALGDINDTAGEILDIEVWG